MSDRRITAQLWEWGWLLIAELLFFFFFFLFGGTWYWRGRSPGGGNNNSVQYSCLKNPMNRGAWWATVHEVTGRRMQLSMHARYLGSYIRWVNQKRLSEEGKAWHLLLIWRHHIEKNWGEWKQGKKRDNLWRASLSEGNSKCEETSHYTWEVMIEKNTSEVWLFASVILKGLEVREFQNLKTGGVKSQQVSRGWWHDSSPRQISLLSSPPPPQF